jgi:hypothetical protein
MMDGFARSTPVEATAVPVWGMVRPNPDMRCVLAAKLTEPQEEGHSISAAENRISCSDMA